MRNVIAITKRELGGYFGTPLAYVFMVIFLALTGAFAIHIGGFFERGQADLDRFFVYIPWLYIMLIPAVAMRLWAEERQTGTVELLMTMPISITEAVLGKFLAAWIFIGLCLLLTFPIWITVNYLGRPDNGAILAAYLGCFLMAGTYLAISSLMSALSKSQVIAFIVAATVCFLFVMCGYDIVLGYVRGWVPDWLVASVASLSLLSRFDEVSRGLISFPSLFYYSSMIVFFLFATVVVIDLRKAS